MVHNLTKKSSKWVRHNQVSWSSFYGSCARYFLYNKQKGKTANIYFKVINEEEKILFLSPKNITIGKRFFSSSKSYSFSD